MKYFRIIILIIVLIVAFLVLQMLRYRQSRPVSYTEIFGSESFISESSSVNLYDPLKDPDNEESPMYKAAEKKSKSNVERTKAIAEAFVFNGVPKEYVEYCPANAGFCFSYPPSWGKLIAGFYTECKERNDLVGFEGKFHSKDDNYFFGASAFTYAAKECETNGRGLGQLDGLPQASPEKADTWIKTISGEYVALWYGDEVGYYTHAYDMVFTAPTSHPLLKRIAFVGPESSSPDLTKEEIEEFLTVAHSYRTFSTELSKNPFCTQPAIIRDDGAEIYPTNEEKYGQIGLFGQLFTADDCGSERLAIFGKDFVSQPDIGLYAAPTPRLLKVLREIGFVPGDTCSSIHPETCTHWTLFTSVPTSEILRLKPFSQRIKSVGCINCG